MDDEDTYPFLSGAAGFAYRDEPSAAGDDDPGGPPAAGGDPGGPPVAGDAETGPPPGDGPGRAGDDEPTQEIPLLPTPYGKRPRAAALLVVVAVLAGVSLLVVAGLATGGEQPPAPRAERPPPAFVEPDVPRFDTGTFELVSSVPELNLTLGRPGDGPIRVTAAPGSGPAPATSVEGTRVRLTAAPGSGRLEVLLDERITWTIRMNGGVRAATFVLTGGTVREVDLSGGADSVVLELPHPERALPIRMSGGVREWSIRTEGRVPVQVRARSGAGEVSLYGRRERGLGRNTTLTAGTGSGLEVTAAAGFGSLLISAR